MTALHVTDVKNFMSQLFVGMSFDSFLFVEGDISTAISYHIDGRVNMDFYTEEELEELKVEEYRTWDLTKPIVTQMIKGKKMPVAMKLILKKAGRGDLTYLFNIRYENDTLVVVSGISRSSFTFDKSGEKEWDDNVKSFLIKSGIDFEEME